MSQPISTTKTIALTLFGSIAIAAAVWDGFNALEDLSSFGTLVFPDLIASLLLIALGVYSIYKGAVWKNPNLKL
ncbi:MAG TPA: hypothetical protein VFO39_02595 [Candidatus Sulfotelmatobacter sp.]|nr:hypothetical protein [Candidatus Sulfotelmatobacter sp.]